MAFVRCLATEESRGRSCGQEYPDRPQSRTGGAERPRSRGGGPWSDWGMSAGVRPCGGRLLPHKRL